MKKLGKHCYIRKFAGYTAYFNKYGRYDRIGGPAIIYDDGGFQYRINGLLHREDGPAIAYRIYEANVQANAFYYYYLNGFLYSKEDFDIEMAKRNYQK